MTSTVYCPDCHRPAVVLSRFSLDEATGPAEYLRIRCAGALTLLVTSDEAPPCEG
ncbi:hypothetical protein ACFPFQ_09570 [Pseudonocardia sp. GCM10023141]